MKAARFWHKNSKNLLLLSSSLLVLLLVVLAIGSKSIPLINKAGDNFKAPSTNQIYWGAYIQKDVFGLPTNPPWDMTAVDRFEADTGKKMSILHFGLPWYSSVNWPQGYYPFVPSLMDKIRNRGMIPFVDWSSADSDATNPLVQPNFTLRSIIDGQHDSYLDSWATAAKNWGHPFFLRFDWEMNGNWFVWSENRNGNQSGEYTQAWRHVHDRFRLKGATNVTWVWCPNAPGPFSYYYPGDAYVDWTCLDAYNWGLDPVQPSRWRSFTEAFSTEYQDYEKLLALAPSKPIIIGETASTEVGGSKSAWITQLLTNELPNRFPGIKGILWFNWNQRGLQWALETSAGAKSAFASGVASSYYASNNFGSLNTSPIPALSLWQPPTPTPTPVPTTSEISIFAWGKPAQGVYPKMELWVDDVKYKRWTKVGGLVGGKTNIFQQTVPYISPGHSIYVKYINDLKVSDREDRALLVDRIIVDGRTYESEAPSVYSIGTENAKGGCGSGYRQTQRLDCNGYFKYTINY